ncbi:hypothetical protein [Streptomyces sp. NBC_00859]|uniref:hypothetical protein n=1 Tax=Streptomyces sp. NBC_00859 TaxID=2903682 RepID=UPI00386E221D|nr:hypothetical protein OG584_32540 [Streptomyces sp. NBC_00859]
MARGAVTVLSLLTWWVLLFLLYTVLISSVSPLELVVGGLAALLGAIAAEALRRVERPRGTVRGLLAAGAAFPVTLLRECGQLACAVAGVMSGRGSTGRRAAFRLEPGASPGWAAVLLAASPGACVIDISQKGGRGGEAELTLHLLGGAVSGVERALPGRHVS